MTQEQRKILILIKESFKENIKPGLILQGLALTVVLLYFFLAPFHQFLENLGELKNRGGLIASGFTTMFFGGIFPFLMLLFSGNLKDKRVFPLLFFYLGFWFWKGMEVDLLYRFQAFLYGDSSRWDIIVRKVLTDQFIYCPFWAVPTMMLFYLWKDSDFKLSEVKNRLRMNSAFNRAMPILASNIVVWLPAVTIVYLLPLSLQMPLFNLILMFWTLILNSIASK